MYACMIHDRAGKNFSQIEIILQRKDPVVSIYSGKNNTGNSEKVIVLKKYQEPGAKLYRSIRLIISGSLAGYKKIDVGVGQVGI